MTQSDPCTPSQLDCVESVTVGREECLERCQGIILEAETLPTSLRDDDGLAQFLADYENYKNPNFSKFDYPDAISG